MKTHHFCIDKSTRINILYLTVSAQGRNNAFCFKCQADDANELAAG
jgi:hypothetical protein